MFGRELQKWEPDEGTSLTDFEETDHQIGTWDQFEENEKRFGVKTDFNMDLYTTRLEPGKSRYSLAEAEKIARDIQNQTSSNIHLQDERGHLAIDDSGVRFFASLMFETKWFRYRTSCCILLCWQMRPIPIAKPTDAFPRKKGFSKSKE